MPGAWTRARQGSKCDVSVLLFCDFLVRDELCGLLDVTWDATDPVLSLQIVGVTGKPIVQRDVKLSELRIPEPPPKTIGF